MNSNNNYKFDVFLSWTGHNRNEKNIVRDFLKENSLVVYDSDIECNGYFIDSCLDALSMSKVYVLFLSKHIDNPDYTSYVMDEFARFNQLAHQKRINIIILDLDTYFNEPHPESEFVHWFNNRRENYETSHIRMFESESFENAFLEKKEIIIKHIKEFIEARAQGKPVYYRELDNGVKYNCEFADNNVVDRDEVLEKISNAFNEGKKNVILYGPGGIGKTSIVNKFIKEHKKDYIQTVFVSSDTLRNSESKVEMVLSNVDFMNTELDKMYRLPSKNQQLSYQREILGRLPKEQFIIIDNIDNLSSDDVEAISRLFPCRLLFTTRSTVDFSDYEVVKIEALNETYAKEVFEAVSKKTISEEEFHNLYETYNGNTMILSMIATLYKSHDDYSVEESLFAFSHNEFAATGTLEDQLKVIFSSAYNKENIDINQVLLILNMSLLSEYAISINDLYENIKHMNKYEIDNAIMLLEKNGGWIDREGDMVYIDRNISNCISEILLEKYFDNDKAKMRDECIRLDLVDYVINNSFNAKLYTDVVREQNNIMHSLKNYAKVCGLLNEELFKRYTLLCEQLRVDDFVMKQLGELQNYINDNYDLAKVVTYKSLMQLRFDPLSDEWFNEFANNLIYCSNYEHKWIIKILSISNQYFSYYNIRKDKMTKCLDNAWVVLFKEIQNSDIENNKTYAERIVAEAMVFYLYYSTVNSISGANKVEKVVKKINKKIKTDNYLLFKLFASYRPLLHNFNGFMNNMMSGNILSPMFKHPIVFLKGYRCISKIGKHIGEDELFLAYQQMIDSLNDNDVSKMVDAIYKLSQYNIKNDLSLIPTGDTIGNMVTFLNGFLTKELLDCDKAEVFDELRQQLKVLQSSNNDLNDLSVLQIEQKIDFYSGNKDALSKSLRLFNAKLQYLYVSHPVMIEELINYFNACSSQNNAVKIMIKYLYSLVVNKKSDYYYEVLVSLLNNYFDYLGVKNLITLYDVIKEVENPNVRVTTETKILYYINKRLKNDNYDFADQTNDSDENLKTNNFLKNFDEEVIKIIKEIDFSGLTDDSKKTIMIYLMHITRITIIGSYDYNKDILKTVLSVIKKIHFHFNKKHDAYKQFYIQLIKCELMYLDKCNSKVLNDNYVKALKLAVKNRLLEGLSVIFNNWINKINLFDFIEMNNMMRKFSFVELMALYDIFDPKMSNDLYNLTNDYIGKLDSRKVKRDYSKDTTGFINDYFLNLIYKSTLNNRCPNFNIDSVKDSKVQCYRMYLDIEEKDSISIPNSNTYINIFEQDDEIRKVHGFLKSISKEKVAYCLFINSTLEDFIRKAKLSKNVRLICEFLSDSMDISFIENDNLVNVPYSLIYVLLLNVNLQDDFQKCKEYAFNDRWNIIARGILLDAIMTYCLNVNISVIQAYQQIKTNLPYLAEKYKYLQEKDENEKVDGALINSVFSDVAGLYDHLVKEGKVQVCNVKMFNNFEFNIAKPFYRNQVGQTYLRTFATMIKIQKEEEK